MPERPTADGPELPGSRRPVAVGELPARDAPVGIPRRTDRPSAGDEEGWLEGLGEGDQRPSGTERGADDETPEHPIILVGGGRIGRALMRKFGAAVVLESDPTKIDRLRDEFGPQRVYHGSGAMRDHLVMAGLHHAMALVACTNSDESNYKAGLYAKDAHVPRVIARLEDPEHAPRFSRIGVEPVAAPLAVCVNIITNLLSPERRTIGEGIIQQGAPTVGERVRDLKLPPGAIVVSILRGDHLRTPDTAERLQAGDVVTVMTEKADLQETITAVTGRDQTINPLDRLYVPLRNERSLKTAFREAYVLAEYAGAELFVVAPEGAEDYVKEAERLCMVNAIPMQSRIFPRRDFARHFMETVEEEDRSEMHGGLKEHIFFECVVIEPSAPGLWKRIFRDTFIDKVTKRLDHPVLIARNLKPYKDILLVIDNTARAPMNVAHTIDLALVYGSDITALLPEKPTGEAFRLLRHLKRTGRIYGVNVRERLIKGNPTIEYIKEVKSGKYDLIIVDWHARSVKRDILRRVIAYGPRSTLVLP